jgi:UDP-N-acetylglucosamine:LPS N-acetylglucosamine transferase
VRVTAALVIALTGLLAGAPVLVAGQLLRIFVEQRQLLARMNRRLSRWGSSVASAEAEEDRGRPAFGEHSVADRTHHLQRRRVGQ